MGQKVIHSSEEWRELVLECRKSGLSDKDWCEQHQIKLSTFYNALSRLRKQACDIPPRQTAHPVMDLTVQKQDVVAIDIVQDDPVGIQSADSKTKMPGLTNQVMNLDNSYTMELVTGNSVLRISNQTDLRLLGSMLQLMRRMEC